MTADIIEGEVRDLEPIRSVVPVQPGQVIVTDTTPVDMLERATAIATALADMVERQRLYTTIRDKKYPQVEAWMTIGRMDNVVAREAGVPVRNEDGSWEAVVELVRLSDGMVIGNGSALCGAKGDSPWDSRPAHQRRSMAVTRATSRAFRQQYSWIMALAGYEPTPADEMPGADDPAPTTTTHEDGLTGEAIAQGRQDFELRQGPDGSQLPFRVKQGRQSQIVVAHGPLADAIAAMRADVLGQRVTVWGTQSPESFQKNGQTVDYTVLHLERIQTAEWTLPAPPPSEPPADPGDRPEAASFAMFSEDEQAAIDAAIEP